MDVIFIKASKKEIIITAAVLVICAAAAVCLYLFSPKGATAVVTYMSTDKTEEIRLDRDGVYYITENVSLPVTLRVENGAIRFENSQCPDHICENFGYISREGEYAVCMPAGLSVTVKE